MLTKTAFIWQKKYTKNDEILLELKKNLFEYNK